MHTENIYQVFDLVKQYDLKQVLNIENFGIERGRVYCLYGPNGSGKTTLFELLTLVNRPTSGRILFNGKEVFPKDEAYEEMRRKTTLVHQNPLLFDTSVEKNVDYGLRIRKQSGPQRKDLVRDCLRFVGLEGFEKKHARKLSGGEAQRVAIARALAIKPQVLFLDEFTANIDRHNRGIVERLIKQINHAFGTTIVFTSHYMDQAYRVSDQVIHLFNGRIVSSQPKNLFRGVLRRTDAGTVFHDGLIEFFVSTHEEGEAVVSIASNAITVSKDRFESSMRNRLKGRISQMTDDNDAVILSVDAGDFFDAVITKESLRKMGLEPGMEVYIYFKASSVEVL